MMSGYEASKHFYKIALIIIVVQFYVITKYIQRNDEYCLEDSYVPNQGRNIISDFNITDVDHFNEEFESKIQKLNHQIRKLSEQLETGREPTLIYEKRRRRIQKTVTSMWEFVKHEITTMKPGNPKNPKHANFSKKLDNFLSTFHHYKLSVIDDWGEMTENDGYNTWRHSARKKLDETIQNRFHHLLNPPDCDKTKLVYCRFPVWGVYCGWGCGIQKFSDCLTIAYGLRRTLVYDTTYFVYGNHDDSYYKISRKCTKINQDELRDWPDDSARIVKFDINLVPYLHNPRFKYLPPALPSDLANQMDKLFGNPVAYWVCQIKLYYRNQEKPEFKAIVKKIVDKIQFSTGPIAGIHVRRTDKNYESAYVQVEKYMVHVDEFFDQQNVTQKIKKRQVFVATDSPDVVEELKKKYSHYKIYYNARAIKSANQTKRMSRESLIGVTADLDLMLKCNFIVLTLSSAFGKTITDLMFSKSFDPSMNVVSVDNMYQIQTAKHNLHKVIYPYKHISWPRLKVNLTIEVDRGFNQHGLVKIRHRNSWTKIPAFVVEPDLDIQEFGTDASIIP